MNQNKLEEKVVEDMGDFLSKTVYCLTIPGYKLRKALELLFCEIKDTTGKIVRYEYSHTLPALHDIKETEKGIDLSLGKQIKGEGKYEEIALLDFRSNLVKFYEDLCKVAAIGALSREEAIQRIYLATILQKEK